MKRVLLFGGSGMLGRALQAGRLDDLWIEAPPSSVVDIADATAVARALDAARPDWVVNAAAYTNVDQAELEPALAERANVTGPGVVGEVCSRYRVPVVHFSTDYVFDGTSRVPYREADPVGPLNVYGRTKLAGERALVDSGAEALILRTSWLYGRHGRSFPLTMAARAQRGEPTRVVNDQYGRPTSAADLAVVTWRLLHAGARGVLHTSNPGRVTTWFGIAERVFSFFGRRDLLSACSTKEFTSAAARPQYSALDTGRLESLIASPLPPWDQALERFLRSLPAETRPGR